MTTSLKAPQQTSPEGEVWNEDSSNLGNSKLLIYYGFVNFTVHHCRFMSNLLFISGSKDSCNFSFWYWACASAALGSAENVPIWPLIIFLFEKPPGIRGHCCLEYNHVTLDFFFVWNNLSRFNHLLHCVRGGLREWAELFLRALYVPSGLPTGKQCLFSPVFSKSWD